MPRGLILGEVRTSPSARLLVACQDRMPLAGETEPTNIVILGSTDWLIGGGYPIVIEASKFEQFCSDWELHYESLPSVIARIVQTMVPANKRLAEELQRVLEHELMRPKSETQLCSTVVSRIMLDKATGPELKLQAIIICKSAIKTFMSTADNLQNQAATLSSVGLLSRHADNQIRQYLRQVENGYENDTSM